MNTKALIDQAVFNTSTTGLKGWGDRLFAWWFNRLVYAQIWEDPQSDLDALQLQPGARLLTISSGGCNALAYLSTKPAAVHAVDLNQAHLATLSLKHAALASLPDYNDLLAFLGDAARPDNVERYQRIAPALDAESRRYWEGRDITGRRRYTLFTRHAYRHGLLGRFIGCSHVLVRLLGGNLGAMMAAQSQPEQHAAFERHVAPVFRNPLVKWLSRRPTALYSLGIPPAQFEAIVRDSGGDLAQEFCERMRRLACDWPLKANCFAQQAFGRRYDTRHQDALPLYLQQRHHATIRAHLGALHTHHLTLTRFLQSQPAASLDAYLFLDAQDWMDADQLTELWREVTRTAALGAKVVFRTGGVASPLERLLPADVLSRWTTDIDHNRRLHATDRSAIYGGMHLYHLAPQDRMA